MPIYEYACQKCGKNFEYMQSVSDDPKTECEECGGELKKLISATSFMLKGDGWYKDLYSSPKPKSDSSGDKPPAAAGADSSKGEGKSKPEAKPSKGKDSK